MSDLTKAQRIEIDYFDPSTNGEFQDFADAVQATVQSREL